MVCYRSAAVQDSNIYFCQFCYGNKWVQKLRDYGNKNWSLAHVTQTPGSATVLLQAFGSSLLHCLLILWPRLRVLLLYREVQMSFKGSVLNWRWKDWHSFPSAHIPLSKASSRTETKTIGRERSTVIFLKRRVTWMITKNNKLEYVISSLKILKRTTP